MGHWGSPIFPGIPGGFSRSRFQTLGARQPPAATGPVNAGAGDHEHSPEFQAMNGEDEWFIWFGVAAASMELGFEQDAWLSVSKVILIGMRNDGVCRERFIVNGFSKGDPETPEK